MVLGRCQILKNCVSRHMLETHVHSVSEAKEVGAPHNQYARKKGTNAIFQYDTWYF